MIKFLIAVSVILASMSSQANTTATMSKKNIAVKTLPTTKKDLVPQSGPRIPAKPKLFRSNPLRKNLIARGSDPIYTIDDEDYLSGYRRRDLQKIHTVDNDGDSLGISDRIRWRLFLARTAAVLSMKNH